MEYFLEVLSSVLVRYSSSHQIQKLVEIYLILTIFDQVADHIKDWLVDSF